MICIDNKESCGGSSGILRSLIEELQRAVRLIGRTDDVAYRRVANGTANVGAQLRHNLDFVGSFLRGIECGLIDYSDRERDARVEVDRQYAATRFEVVISRLEQLDETILRRAIRTRSEVDPVSVFPSSIGREVEFVHSHTVHHHALIREKLAGFGIAVDEYLGVAPSTINYWADQAA